MNRQTKRMLQRQGQTNPDGSPAARAQQRQTQRPVAKQERQSIPARIGQFVREVRNELVKVAWPGRAEVINYTAVVFVTVVLLTSIVFGLDYGFAAFIKFLFKT